MITIKNIANEAQVSEGTVDRVIHNRGGVSKKTEKKIRSILKKYDFKVNPVASALASKHKYNVAALVPSYDNTNVFWKYPHLGIKRASEEVKNFGVLVHEYRFDQFDPVSYVEQFEKLIGSNPSGVIIVPSFIRETRVLVKQLEDRNIPYLFFNIDAEGFQNLCFIGQDSFKGGYVAAKLMNLALGNQTHTLSIVQTRSNITNYHAITKRIEGFKDYFKDKKTLIENVDFVFADLGTAKDAKEKINSYFKSREDIRGLFVPSSRISIIVNLLEEELLGRMQLIGFDNTPQNIRCLEQGKISFLISQKPFFQGYESVHLLSEYLVNNKIPVKKMYAPIDILIKENAKYNVRTGLEFENQQQE